MTSRYQYLNDLIARHKPSTIVEVGTWKGDRAIQMAEQALLHQEKVHYVGFDLFDDRDDQVSEREMCGTKAPASLADVRRRLDTFARARSGFSFELHKGDSRETMPELTPSEVDFAFIDGGHSVDTVRNDHFWLKNAKVIAFDDYFEPDDEGNCPDVDQFGCNTVVEELDFALMPSRDPVSGGGVTRIAVVPRAAVPDQRRMVVKTKNCVETDVIQANIDACMSREGLRFARQAAAHDLVALMASGGPSLEAYFERFRFRKPTERLVCVKHAHDRLLKAGIVPDICILLDPRPKVGDFIANPHPRTLYFVASMCAPVVLDTLLEKGAKTMIFHAMVGAEEKRLLPGHILVQGGSTASTRGVSLLHALGFQRFELYGYDLCWEENPDPEKLDSRGKPMYFPVMVNDRTFITTAEKIAEAQDCERLLKEQGIGCEVFGDGMVAHIWKRLRRPTLSDVLEAA